MFSLSAIKMESCDTILIFLRIVSFSHKSINDLGEWLKFAHETRTIKYWVLLEKRGSLYTAGLITLKLRGMLVHVVCYIFPICFRFFIFLYHGST